MAPPTVNGPPLSVAEAPAAPTPPDQAPAAADPPAPSPPDPAPAALSPPDPALAAAAPAVPSPPNPDPAVPSPPDPVPSKASTPTKDQSPAKVENVQHSDPRGLKKENKRKDEDLTKARERAQLTATSAMSVVHVALLKELLTAGPERAHYFTANLVLISICLVLQIFAGAISLAIHHMRVSYKIHRGNVCEEIVSNICCCYIECKKQDDNNGKSRPTGTARKGKGNNTGKSQPSPIEGEDQGNNTEIQELHDNNTQTGCCPCAFKRYTDVEATIMNRYHGWKEEHFNSHMEAAKVDVEIKYSGEKEEFKETIKAKDIKCAEGKALWTEASNIRKSYMLKRTGFWLKVLNYIFYIVFVLNIFITGLGISHRYPAQSMNNSTQSASAST